MDESDKMWLDNTNYQYRVEERIAQEPRSADTQGICGRLFISEDEFELVMGLFETLTGPQLHQELPDFSTFKPFFLAPLHPDTFALQKLYRQHAARLQQTGGGIGVDTMEGDDGKEYMAFYVPPTGPDCTTKLDELYMPAHLSTQHWIVLAADFKSGTMRFGIAFSDLWSRKRILCRLTDEGGTFPIGRQRDTSNCGICWADAVSTSIWDDAPWTPETAVLRRLNWFLKLASWCAKQPSAPSSSIPPPLPRHTRIGMADLLNPQHTRIGMDDLLNPVPASSSDTDSDTNESGAESLYASSLHSDSSFRWDSDGDEAARKVAGTDRRISPPVSEAPQSSAAPSDVDMYSVHSSEQSTKSKSSVKSALLVSLRNLTQTVLAASDIDHHSFSSDGVPPDAPRRNFQAVLRDGARKLQSTTQNAIRKRQQSAESDTDNESHLQRRVGASRSAIYDRKARDALRAI
ncbi:hypothetical protein B0H14DRAFT_2628028 [Mycena olivaceomarginata]|nr:hypothetical protein B0H14DRAFT_2628028 [Mycena olivaceomarginata]